MAIYGPSTGFAGPKTVTFNPPPQDEAQFRSARLGGRVIAGTLGIASGALALVALIMTLAVVAALSASWSELLTLGLVASGVVAALIGLPIAGALMQRAYPVESRRAMGFWAVSMLVVAVAAAWTAGRLTPPAVRDRAPKTVAAPLAPPIVNSRWMTTDIWQGTDGCTKMRTDYDGVICEEFVWKKGQLGVVEPPRGTVTEGASWDLSPSAVLGVVGVGDGIGRRLAVLMLHLLAVAGAGLFGRWAVLSTAETYRLGISEASAPPQAPLPAAPVAATSAGVVPPADPFALWAEGRLIPDASAEVAAEALWNDYATTMQLNGLQGMSQARFFNALTDLAKRSGGRIVKVKNDTIRYRGVRLAGGGSAATQADSAWLN